MQFTAVFDSFEEMMEFAEKMQRKETGSVPESPAEEKTDKAEPAIVEAPATKNEQTVTYGRQIAEHFPNANTGMVTPPPAPQVQTSAPNYTLDDLSSAAMTLMDKGMQAQLQQLLAGYGVASLPELPKDQYGAFATALRGMGAQI